MKIYRYVPGKLDLISPKYHRIPSAFMRRRLERGVNDKASPANFQDFLGT